MCMFGAVQDPLPYPGVAPACACCRHGSCMYFPYTWAAVLFNDASRSSVEVPETTIMPKFSQLGKKLRSILEKEYAPFSDGSLS